jgi:hypothetical protein
MGGIRWPPSSFWVNLFSNEFETYFWWVYLFLFFFHNSRKSKFSKDNGFGGVIIWEITQDDWQKKCCKVNNPMLKAINYGLFGTGENPSTYGCE